LEAALKNPTALAVASLLCLGGGTVQAQPQTCGGDFVCTRDRSHTLAVPRDSPLVAAKLASAAARWPCAAGPADVAAETREKGEFACAAIGSAVQLLGRCGIAVRRPLHLEIKSEVRHPLHKAEIFGHFDAKRDIVLVAQLARFPELIRGTPFAKLPMLDVYRSVIVHEVVHAIMHQNMKRPALSHVANEYPAYALQLESLSPNLRNIYLQSFNQADIEDTSALFNDLLLFFNPFHFAAHACPFSSGRHSLI
jgi:hypothetical protein